MITLENIRYRSLAIGQLRIAPGVTSVIGPNGSGKTTLLKLLSGIALSDSGTILIDGVPPRNAEIGWVNEFPDRNILFGTVHEEIASPLRFRHLPCRETDRRVTRIMESTGIQHLADRAMPDLSGGEKVLVALAAAMVTDPQVLVLDEYDSHLDAGHAAEIAGRIGKCAIPYVIHCTQDMDAAARADTILFCEKGTVAHAGTPDKVFKTLEGSAFYPLSWRCRG
jgi:energy-coupling factor transport system ATP-binding protein